MRRGSPRTSHSYGGAFLIAVVVVGCGGGASGNSDERSGERGAAATNEETTAPEGDRPKALTAQEPVGFDAKVVSPFGQANIPEGFGEGSLWATDYDPSGGCDDVKIAGSDSDSSEAIEESCGAPVPGEPENKMLLKRVDPRTGEVVAAIPFSLMPAGILQVAVGAGSVWVSNGYYSSGPAPRGPSDVVLRIDPRTKRVVDRIPVDLPTALAYGHGSVWVTSASYGTLSRIDPKSGEVVAKIDVDRGAVEIAADESSGAVWVGGVTLNYDKPENNKLSRVDPATNRVVAQIPIRAGVRYGGGASNVAVGEGAVWVLSSDARLLKVDPTTNEVAGMVSLGGYSRHLAVYGGGVWAMVQARAEALRRVDPRTMHVVASEDIGRTSRIGTGGLAAGGGYVWFSSGEGLARVSP